MKKKKEKRKKKELTKTSIFTIFGSGWIGWARGTRGGGSCGKQGGRWRVETSKKDTPQQARLQSIYGFTWTGHCFGLPLRDVVFPANLGRLIRFQIIELPLKGVLVTFQLCLFVDILGVSAMENVIWLCLGTQKNKGH